MISKCIHLSLVAILLVCSAGLAGEAPLPVAAAVSPALPSDCLVVIAIDHPAQFAAELSSLVTGFGVEADAGQILTQIGGIVNNPTLSGYDLTAPAYLFFMDSETQLRQWVCQWEVADSEPLLEAVQRGELRIDGRTATWGVEGPARDAVAQWRMERPSGFNFRSRGGVVLHADVDGLMRAYEDEIERQVVMMKERMRIALERPEVSSGREEAIAAAQAEMNTALAVLRQVADVELSGTISGESVVLGIDVMAAQGTPLAGVIGVHPKGSLNLLSRCPGDATVVVMHNVSVRPALKRLLMRVLGMGKAFDAPKDQDASEGQRYYALLVDEIPGNPIQLLQVAVGDAAMGAALQWEGLLNPVDSQQLPFRLRLLEQPPGDGDSICFAEIATDESAADAPFARTLHWLFGGHPIAAHAVVADQSILMAGESVARLRRRIDGMAAANGDSLLKDKSFVRTTADMPAAPNMVVYVSPEGIRRWLSLTGAQLEARPDETLGFCAGAAFREDGRILGAMVVPLGAVERAMGLEGETRVPEVHVVEESR